MKQPAHARLQLAIRDWMRNEIPECAMFFTPYPDEEDCLRFEADLVACAAADAAYGVVELAATVANLKANQ